MKVDANVIIPFIIQTLFSAAVGAVISWYIAKWQIKAGSTEDDRRQKEALEAGERQRQEDKDWERQKLAETKNAKILLMIGELQRLQEFYVLNNQVHEGYNYSIETKVIETTVTSDSGLFKSDKLLSKLIAWKQKMKIIHQSLDSLNALPQNYSNGPMNVWRANWNSEMQEGKKLNTELRELLLAEYVGVLPDDFKRWRIS